MAAPALNSYTSLFDVSPCTMEKFCKMMDCCDGDLGWTGLAERLSSDWMEFRKIEKCAEQGKSRTRELLWSWAQKNKTVGDLLTILQAMGHERAIHLFISQGARLIHLPGQNNLLAELKDVTSENGGVNTLAYVTTGTPGSQHKEKNALPSISLKVIKDGTKDFHRDLLVGEGQFFDVYKAEILKQKCVVKVLKQEKTATDQKQWKLFISELKGLSRFHHQNILELIGYFSSDEKTCLVYPYMINGSLFDKIQCTGNSTPLSWQIRFSILVGVARAIQHLHAVKPCPLICGNINSKNILLDQHFQPKLSDFAMVHLRSYLINHTYTIKMDYATREFLGYLPEEYIRRGKLSAKIDVYSYGILIMEILTGCKAVIEGSKNIFLRDLMWDLMEKSGVESLLPLLDKKAEIWPQSVAHKLLSLSIECTTSRDKLRPTMDEVQETIDNYKYTCQCNKDQPKSLKCVPPHSCPAQATFIQRVPSNVPIESDESQDYPVRLPQSQRPPETPCECSQSEVTFLGATMEAADCRAARKAIPSLIPSDIPVCAAYLLQLPEPSFISRPVECNCSSGPDSTKFCEECMTNGFGPRLSNAS
ncbi:hypothetical protein FKM82_012583 [Ascaphus truei]